MITTSASPRISIIGAGLAGLSLVTHLQRHGIAATIYEKDPSFEARANVGSILDMHYESGQRALNEANIDWKSVTIPQGEETRCYDSKGTLLYKDEPASSPPHTEEHSRPEIPRTVLRKLFYDCVSASGSIKWSHSFKSARRLPDGTYELTFADGTIEKCDLIVGADGAWSKVRPLVSSEKPSFSGITGAEISITSSALVASDELRDIDKKIGNGTAFGLHKGSALITQRGSEGRIRTYAWFHAEESFTLPTDAAAARAILLSRYEGWAPWFRQLISECDGDAIYLRPLHTLPAGHKWTSVPGVTLIGDAAHLMSPFAGEGANLALLDGLELALALASAKDSGKWQEAVAVFEKKMCDRAAEFAAESQQNLELFLGNEAPESVVKVFKSMASPNSNPPPTRYNFFRHPGRFFLSLFSSRATA
ncbi:FAD/NAD-P-binding domain-containing protein [Mycena vitilis]|nr:FAD/NAD-P-binding domain-containing protein [Mycena vitilis]